MTVRYHRRALAQIAEIIQSLATEDAAVASAFARRVEALASLLSRHPSIGRPTSLGNVRVVPAKPYSYLIFYRPVGDDGVTILRVRHMARDEDWRMGR